MEAFSESQRRHLRCGFVRRDRWAPVQQFRGIPGVRDAPELCPGYSTQLPRVVEVARLWGWEQRGSIELNVRTRGWRLSDSVLDMVDVFAAEQSECERWSFEQARKKAGK
jgi:hypothetical protein